MLSPESQRLEAFVSGIFVSPLSPASQTMLNTQYARLLEWRERVREKSVCSCEPTQARADVLADNAFVTPKAIELCGKWRGCIGAVTEACRSRCTSSATGHPGASSRTSTPAVHHADVRSHREGANRVRAVRCEEMPATTRGAHRTHAHQLREHPGTRTWCDTVLAC